MDTIERVKNRARKKVYYAVRDGKLERKPCEECGTKKAEAHHDDYAKPLEVRWLCKRHHEYTHKTFTVFQKVRCDECGTEFERAVYAIKKRNFCSREHMIAHMRNNHGFAHGSSGTNVPGGRNK